MSGWQDIDEAVAHARGALVGERVALRALHEDDLPQLQAWWEDPAVAPAQRASLTPRPAGAAATMFRSWSANDAPGSVGFSVVTRSGGDLVGHVVLHGAQLPARAATLAITIGPEHAGQGYGTDAVRVLLRHGFAEMGLHRVELHVYAFNAPAIAVYRRAGFVEEGRRRDAVFHDGRFHDEVLMSVLEPEWLAARAEDAGS